VRAHPRAAAGEGEGALAALRADATAASAEDAALNAWLTPGERALLRGHGLLAA
jgi:hypothetical protein